MQLKFWKLPRKDIDTEVWTDIQTSRKTTTGSFLKTRCTRDVRVFFFRNKNAI